MVHKIEGNGRLVDDYINNNKFIISKPNKIRFKKWTIQWAQCQGK